MAHIRKQIRDAVISELIELAAEGFYVSATKASSLSPEQLPAVIVKMGVTESSEAVTMGRAPTLERTATLSVSAIVKDDEAFLDGKLEDAAERIEFYIQSTHGGLAKSTLLTSTEKESASIDEIDVSAITLEYAVVYHTASNQPNIAL